MFPMDAAGVEGMCDRMLGPADSDTAAAGRHVAAGRRPPQPSDAKDAPALGPPTWPTAAGAGADRRRRRLPTRVRRHEGRGRGAWECIWRERPVGPHATPSTPRRGAWRERRVGGRPGGGVRAGRRRRRGGCEGGKSSGRPRCIEMLMSIGWDAAASVLSWA